MSQFEPRIDQTQTSLQASPSPNVKPIVLITGRSGLIGSRLTRELDSGFTVIGLDVKQPKESQAPFVKCDLTDASSTAAAMRQIAVDYGNRIASVIHLAAYYDLARHIDRRNEMAP